MKRFLFTIIITCYFISGTPAQVFENEVMKLFNDFSESYFNGNFLRAEQSLLKMLELPLNEYEECSTYCNLGSVCIVLGRFDEALDYFSKAEQHNPETRDGKFLLAGVLINKAIIYRNRRSFANARDYFEKGIRLYHEIINLKGQYETSLAKAYYNFGIYYLTVGDYKTALDYYRKSSDIKQKHNISNYLEIMNTARVYAGLKVSDSADTYFRECLSLIVKERSDNFRLADFYLAYSQFQQSTGKIDKALEYSQNALKIFLQSFGEKHNLTSLAYKSIGDLFQSRLDYDSSLYYYQKSLISVVRDFNDLNIYVNPEVDSSILDIRLLDNLKGKANAFEKKALAKHDIREKVKDLDASLSTIRLALDLIEIIKNNYPSEESQLYLADNEKETFMSAMRISSELFSLTGNENIPGEMFSIAQRAKASILRSQVKQNDILYSSSTPDSLRKKQRVLSAAIAAYNKHMRDEIAKPDPDNTKIEFWKDELFNMNREKESVEKRITELYPQYLNFIKRMQPVTYDDLRKRLKKDETIIDYILSNIDTGGNRQLYVFLISRKGLHFQDITLDSTFNSNALFLRNIADPSLEQGGERRFYNNASALHYMYMNLISPVEHLIDGKRLTVIPDEEIAWLPFEAFLKEMPDNGSYDFEDLDFLINHYTFSYGYSASLISQVESKIVKKPEVLSFSPSYGLSSSSPDSLEGAMKEIIAIGRIFRGQTFTREEATKENFINGIQKPAILHLAMHSISDSANSLYSYLLFSPAGGDENSRLYNYEISLSRLNSPMIVLSSCNSGTGTLYSGEGLMSLARSFMLAGASSVVRTAWEVNDESGSAIITRFYYHLSHGKRKDDALRLSKLEFIRESPPASSDPYYWAAYEVLGDASPIDNAKKRIVTFVTILIISCAVLIFYFRRRRISSERSM